MFFCLVLRLPHRRPAARRRRRSPSPPAAKSLARATPLSAWLLGRCVSTNSAVRARVARAMKRCCSVVLSPTDARASPPLARRPVRAHGARATAVYPRLPQVCTRRTPPSSCCSRQRPPRACPLPRRPAAHTRARPTFPLPLLAARAGLRPRLRTQRTARQGRAMVRGAVSRRLVSRLGTSAFSTASASALEINETGGRAGRHTITLFSRVKTGLL